MDDLVKRVDATLSDGRVVDDQDAIGPCNRVNGLTAAHARARSAAQEYLRLAAAVGGCGDGGCVIHVRGGQHTNGGCRCTRNMDMQRQFQIGHLLRTAQALARVITTVD